MPPPLFLAPFFGVQEPVDRLHHRLFLRPIAGLPGGKDVGMKLKIRYEDEYQMIELDAEAAEGLFVSLSLESDDDLSQEEKEELIQDTFDELFNGPEYSNWRRHNRSDKFDPNPKVKKLNGKAGAYMAGPDNPDFNAMDYLCTTSDEETIEQDLEYEEICAWIRQTLVRRPQWAEIFIAVCMDGETVRSYAGRKGMNENSAAQWLVRAKRTLREAWEQRRTK